jgi:hypothetical protein
MTRRALVALAAALAAAAAHAAEPNVAAELVRIDAEFDAARERCDDRAGQAKNVCLAEARAERRVRKVEVAARGEGTPKARYDAKIARAEAEFDVQKERCGEQAGAARDGCIAEARTREAKAKDEARAERREAEGRSEARK